MYEIIKRNNTVSTMWSDFDAFVKIPQHFAQRYQRCSLCLGHCEKNAWVFNRHLGKRLSANRVTSTLEFVGSRVVDNSLLYRHKAIVYFEVISHIR